MVRIGACDGIGGLPARQLGQPIRAGGGPVRGTPQDGHRTGQGLVPSSRPPGTKVLWCACAPPATIAARPRGTPAVSIRGKGDAMTMTEPRQTDASGLPEP